MLRKVRFEMGLATWVDLGEVTAYRGVRNGGRKGSEVRDFFSKRASKVRAVEDSRRALLGNKIVEADGDRAWKGLESPHENSESHLVDR